MIFKFPNGFPFELYFVTGEMLEALALQTVPFDGLRKISAYHDKLTFNEVANFVATQHAAGKLFGVDMPEPSQSFGEGYNGGMIAEAFNAIDSEAISNYLKNATVFHAAKIGQVILIAVNTKGPETGSWDKLHSKNISTAVLETIYGRVGYLDTHFGSVITPALGELTLAEVYKLVHVQNP